MKEFDPRKIPCLRNLWNQGQRFLKHANKMGYWAVNKEYQRQHAYFAAKHLAGKGKK